MYRRGFSIVELIIVITVMGILLVLGVVNMRSTQSRARDDERKTDIETIALQLENYFNTGTDGWNASTGSYPTTDLVSSVQTTLRDADMKSFTAPGAASLAASFVTATNNTQTTAGVTPAPTISTYVYQPLQPDGTLCTGVMTTCRKFNLYYMLETDGSSNMVKSKNQ